MSRAATWTVRAATFTALVSLLSACHTTRVVWAKPGGDSVQLQTDMQACGYQPSSVSQTYQASGAPPVYQTRTMTSGYPTNPMAPTYANESTKSATIDVQDSQRSPVHCMIARGWRLMPMP
ncbi:MAG TPA: hypothetical protein VEU53_01100 [Stellaceae bacterium]|nr:hypothetical protein [Stellaceae bacterium]